jgi:peptidoglycan-associated lipoprotein
MKIMKLTLVLAAAAALTLLNACSSNGDAEQMSPYAGGAGGPGTGDISGTGGLDAFGNPIGGSKGGFGPGAGGLPGRPGSEWTPIPGAKLAPVYFAFDQYSISSTEAPKIQAAADYMKQNPANGMIIEGNCDERGSAEYNMGLGERRALAVRDYMVKLGVPDNRMQTISYGSERPADPGHSEQSWSKNRRGELVPAHMK